MNERTYLARSWVAGLAIAAASAAEPVFRVDPAAAGLLDRYCIDCHEEGTEKGDLRLDNLEELPLGACGQ